MRYVLALATVLVTQSYAFAAEIDFSAVLHDPYGVEYLNEKKQPLTLGYLSIASLSAALESDRNEAYKTKVERMALAMKIADAENHHQPIKLDAHDITLLQDRMAHATGNSVMIGIAGSMLEQ